MKKKLALLSLAAVSCICATAALAACSGEDTTHTHNMTFTAATAATCTEAGNSAYYYCEDCGKYYSDESGTTEITLSSTVIEALGHNYETTFTWTADGDGYTATATEVCKNDSSHTETVTAVVTEQSSTAAGCTTTGSVTYLATATFTNGTETEEKTFSTAPTGHTYSAEWTANGTHHWHEAICEHEGEISEYAEHTYALNDNGNYECTVCGYEVENLISESNTALAIGENQLYFADGDSYLQNLTVKVEADGVYTFSILNNCEAVIYISDASGNSYRLGDAGYADPSYSIEILAAAGEDITLTYVGPIENITFEGSYVFCLTVGYEYQYIAPVGSETNPYSFTEPSLYGADTYAAKLAAGESVYFSVSSESDVLSQIHFSYADTEDAVTPSFELYADGVKIDYGTYYFSSGATAVTFCLKNVSSEQLTNTIYCEAYQPFLSTSDNALTITSAMLDSANGIEYSITLNASTTYAFTFGSNTDSNVALYYDGELVLGNGSDAQSFKITNSRTRQQTYKVVITYVGETVPESFNVNLSVGESTPDIETLALTLGTATETTLSYSSGITTANFTYTAAESGSYTLTLTVNNNWNNVYSAYATVTVNNATVSDNDDGVYNITLKAGANTITVLLNTNGTLSATLTSANGDTDTDTALSVGTNDVTEDTTYTFTADAAGTYTFTVSGTNGWAMFYESSSSWTPFFNEQEGDTEYQANLAAGESITIYVTNGGEGDFVINIASSETTLESVYLAGSNTVSAALSDAASLNCYLYNRGNWTSNSYYNANCTIYTLSVTSSQAGGYCAELAQDSSNDGSSLLCVAVCQAVDSLDGISATMGDTAYEYGEQYLYVLATADASNASDYFDLAEGTYYILVYESYGEYDVSGSLSFIAE